MAAIKYCTCMFALQRTGSCELSRVRSLNLQGLVFGVNSSGLVSIIYSRACGHPTNSLGMLFPWTNQLLYFFFAKVSLILFHLQSLFQCHYYLIITVSPRYSISHFVFHSILHIFSYVCFVRTRVHELGMRQKSL